MIRDTIFRPKLFDNSRFLMIFINLSGLELVADTDKAYTLLTDTHLNEAADVGIGLFAHNDAAAGLMSGENEHFGNLHVLGGVGGIDGHIGDVVARKRLDALIEFGRTGRITVEADVAEVGLDKAGLEVGDADGCVGHIDAESVGEGLHGCLRSTVDIASGIGGITRHTSYINNVSAVAFNHTGHDEACHGQQTFDIGVDHRLPVVEVALIFRFKSQGKAGIIDEHVNLLPLLRQTLDGLAGCIAISDVEGEDEHFGALGLQLLADGF